MDVYYEVIFEEEKQKMKIYANGKCHNVRIFSGNLFLSKKHFQLNFRFLDYNLWFHAAGYTFLPKLNMYVTHKSIIVLYQTIFS